eukprot:8602451-Pyramimonas_sp.AAC.1
MEMEYLRSRLERLDAQIEGFSWDRAFDEAGIEAISSSDAFGPGGGGRRNESVNFIQAHTLHASRG